MSTVGNRFAYRERVRAFGEPVCSVEVTREGPPRSNKARVRWLDGEYEGLEEWVPKIRLLAPWEQAEALLEDERRMLAAVEVSEDAYDEATREAAGEVFGALSEHSTPQEEIAPLTPDQARAFLEAARGDKFESLFILALHCGLTCPSPARRSRP